MESCRWMLLEPVALMQSGVRDLQSLTQGLDRGTQIVVEAILLKVLQVEKESKAAAAAASGSAIAALGPALPAPGASAAAAGPNAGPVKCRVVPLRRQLSVGTAARSVLSQLSGTVPPAVFARIVKFLYKTFTYIRNDPSNLMYRRIKKSSQLLTLHILPSKEAMSVLTSAGFTNGGEEGEFAELLVMHTVDVDKISRLLQVLKEEAAEAGVEL
jgi:hypothetical protein